MKFSLLILFPALKCQESFVIFTDLKAPKISKKNKNFKVNLNLEI